MAEYMTKDVFRDRWESDADGGGITFDDVAECAQRWGVTPRPKTKPINEVLSLVLAAAGVGATVLNGGVS